MIRKAVIAITVLFVSAAFMLPLTAAEQKVPETVTIEKAQNKKPPVTFPHLKHSEQINCLKCHHDAKSNADAQSCFVCHGTDPAAPDPAVASANENPFHIRCKGCHKEQGKGPTKCKDCHKE